MPEAANASIAWVNLADTGSITATSFAPLTPPARLQDPHVARKWRSIGNSASIVVDLGAVRDIDTVMMAGLTLTAAGVTRVRASLADASGQDGSAFDSGSAAGRVDPRYGVLLTMMPARVSARYVRTDLQDATLPWLEAGRQLVAARYQFQTNFSYGWGRSYLDRSRRTESRGGQTYIDRGRTLRRVDVPFENLTVTERHEVIEEIDRLNGEHTDILLVLDGESDNLGRDSIWGLVEGLSALTQPTSNNSGNGGLYSKTFSIRERL